MSQPTSLSIPADQPKPRVLPLASASFLFRLISGGVLLNLFVFTLVGLSIQQSHRHDQGQAAITAQNLTRALESEISGAIRTDDLALVAVIYEYEKQSANGHVDGKILNAYIERVRSRLPEIDALRITDAQGVLVYGNDVHPGSNTSLADRPHFRRLHETPEAGLVISKPQISRVNRKWVIVIARRIDKPDGSFGGMAFAAIALDHLSKTFSVLDVGQHGVVSLLDSDLGLVVRDPEPWNIGSAIGQKVASPTLLAMIQAGRKAGTYIAPSVLDGTERMFSYRGVGTYPFVVVVDLATGDYLAEWRNETAKQATLALLFAMITLCGLWLIYRLWRRQSNAVVALVRQEAKFHTLADFTYDWEYWQGPNGSVLYMTPSCERVTGYTSAEFVADPGLLQRIIYPEDRHVMDQHLQDPLRQIACQDAVQIDCRIVRRDGEIRWIAHHCKAISGRNGESMGRRISNRDITERKCTERAVERERIRLHTILRTACDGIHIVDRDGVLVEANEAFLNMLGYDRSVIGELKITDWDALDQWEHIKARIEDLITRHDPVLFQTQHRRRDGAILDVEINATGIEIEGKEFIYAASRDISERKQTATLLAESEARNRMMIETANEGIVVLDADHRITFVNARMAAMADYPAAEIVGSPIENFLFPEDRDEQQEQKAARQQGLESVYERRLRRRDGSELRLRVSAAPILDGSGHFAGSFGMCSDVTDRDRAQQQLAERELELHAIIETEPDCVKQLAVDGSLLQMNRAGLNMIEADSLDQVLGQKVQELVTPEYRDAFIALTQRVFAGESGELMFQVRGLKGGHRWLETHAVPLRNAQGRIISVLGLTRDISERKQHEALEEDAKRQLESQLAEISELHKRLQEEVIRDPLTGLYNRRFLDETLPRELSRAKREGYSLALIMIDLDHFKQVNDTYGHAAGDEVLKALSAILEESARESDFVCRYGGEEFLIALPRMSPEQARQRVEAWCLELSEAPTRHADFTIVVTFSAGIAAFPDNGTDVQTLLLRADEALYRSKNEGRNRITCFEATI